ncbi:hypothetical protein [Mycetocola sp. 2940]|uniref:hypothetical protein n=1 Tax=Mycetocola sp. 2940 TaxID=3156452 RepID=UPI0033924544
MTVNANFSDENDDSPDETNVDALDAIPGFPFPISPASGLYTYSALLSGPLPPAPVREWPRNPQHPVPPDPPFGHADAEWSGAEWADDGNVVGGAAVLPLFRSEDLRLDVDGNFAQMTASGTAYSRLTARNHWIASLTATSTGWSGDIWYKDNAPSFPYTRVTIRVVRPSFWRRPTAAIVRFSGAGAPFTRVYAWTSARFRSVEFEYDTTPDANQVISVDTHDHPNRPAGIRDEVLTIDTVYRRAGFDVRNSGGSGSVPVSGAGANGTWSDAEMHDAMQTYWSRFSNAPKWSMWVFSAALHDMGESLGGIMFDDIGPNHRQGTAIFTEAFISVAPSADPAPAAWVRRMRFWTTAHEMGHAFNLAHSWQKSLGTAWIPLVDEPEARSFMNYPYAVSGGEAAFFATFDYRFSNAELLFLRHAPARFVQMGNANWFDNHGFESPDAALQAAEYRLEVRANRERAEFEFLEPVVLEVKLTNEGRDPKIVDSTTLDSAGLVVIIKPDGKPARQWIPYATACVEPRAEVLEPGLSSYESLPLFAGLNGWDVAEPGVYDVHVAAAVDGAIVFSTPLRLRIAAPQNAEEERLAGEFFTEDVGRALTFSGTVALVDANETLRKTVDRLPSSAAAVHAAVALAQPLARDFKSLTIPETDVPMTSVADADGSVALRRAKPDQALSVMSTATSASSVDAAAETLGHIGFRREVEQFAVALSDAGDSAGAASLQTDLAKVLSDRGVLPRVVDEVAEKAGTFAGPKSKRSASTKSAGATSARGGRTKPAGK